MITGYNPQVANMMQSAGQPKAGQPFDWKQTLLAQIQAKQHQMAQPVQSVAQPQQNKFANPAVLGMMSQVAGALAPQGQSGNMLRSWAGANSQLLGNQSYANQLAGAMNKPVSNGFESVMTAPQAQNMAAQLEMANSNRRAQAENQLFDMMGSYGQLQAREEDRQQNRTWETQDRAQQMKWKDQDRLAEQTFQKQMLEQRLAADQAQMKMQQANVNPFIELPNGVLYDRTSGQYKTPPADVAGMMRTGSDAKPQGSNSATIGLMSALAPHMLPSAIEKLQGNYGESTPALVLSQIKANGDEAAYQKAILDYRKALKANGASEQYLDAILGPVVQAPEAPKDTQQKAAPKKEWESYLGGVK